MQSAQFVLSNRAWETTSTRRSSSACAKPAPPGVVSKIISRCSRDRSLEFTAELRSKEATPRTLTAPETSAAAADASAPRQVSRCWFTRGNHEN